MLVPEPAESVPQPLPEQPVPLSAKFAATLVVNVCVCEICTETAVGAITIPGVTTTEAVADFVGSATEVAVTKSVIGPPANEDGAV